MHRASRVSNKTSLQPAAMPSKTKQRECNIPSGQAAVIVVDSDEEEKRLPDHFAEFFSVPRVTYSVIRRGLRATLALDLRTGFDFLEFSARQQALLMLATVCPMFVMLSPPCTMFSALQTCFKNFEKMDPVVFQRRMSEVLILLEFGVMVARFQIQHGRWYAWEHPSTATSWRTGAVQSLMDESFTVDFDMCAMGLQCPESARPIKKRTRLMSNYSGIIPVFSRYQCSCSTPHREIQGQCAGMKLSEICQHYPAGFCESLAEVVEKAVRP